MDASKQLIAAWSYGLASCVYLLFALYLASSPRAGLRSRALLVAVVLCALWALLGLAFALTGQRLFLAAGLSADTLRFGGWFLFFFALLKPEAAAGNQWPARLRWLAALAAGLVFIGIAAQIMAIFNAGFGINPQRLILFDALGLTVFALVLIEQLYRTVAPDWRWSIKPLCLGFGGAVLFDLYLYSDALLFNQIDVDAFSIRGFVHALVVPLVAASTLRSRDWKTRLVLSQRVALQSAALVAVGVYLLFTAAAGYYVRYFGGEWGRAFQLALLFAALLLLGMLSLSGTMRAKARVLIGKNFFSYRYDYREEWLRFTNTLSFQDGFAGLGQHAVKGLADMVESPAGALWLKDPSESFFAQAACWNMPISSVIEKADSPLCRFFIDSGWVINLEEYRSLPRRYDNLDLPGWLAELPNAWLLVPLATGSEMIGFVVLATARTRIDVNWEVNDLLKTAGRQAGAFLGQLRATEALLESRKFDAFNRMSAFVVHDLKNVVAQLSLMLKNAERHQGNPEFRKDMLMTVEHSVERMRQLLLQLRDGAKPVDSARGIDLGEIIKRIGASKMGQGRELEIELAENVVAMGHEERLERVIGHMVQNALDATEKGGGVRVTLSRRGAHALVKVSDEGVGMSPEFIRERLFKPFQSTKAAGMGLGAYESFQYVRELGGDVAVSSMLDAGTEVSLLFPLFDSGADLVPKKLLAEAP